MKVSAIKALLDRLDAVYIVADFLEPMDQVPYSGFVVAVMLVASVLFQEIDAVQKL